MPRDLQAEKDILESMPPLSKDEPDVSSPPVFTDPMPLYRGPTKMLEERFMKVQHLNPYSLLLNQDDLDECDWLEHASFEPHEAATREKLDYRLHVCGELCSGIFSSGYTTSSGRVGELVRSRTFPGIDPTDSDRKRILLGHIVATKHTASLVTDAAMDYPKDWHTKYELSPSSGTGHNEDGRTVCLHSLCVHPNFQDLGLGRLLLRSYTQRIRDSGVADRIALICKERFIKFYRSAGFRLIQESPCQYGGGGWYDMVMEFDDGDLLDEADL